MKRYERHADAIAQLIHSGALRPGDRVPSAVSYTHLTLPTNREV